MQLRAHFEENLVFLGTMCWSVKMHLLVSALTNVVIPIPRDEFKIH